MIARAGNKLRAMCCSVPDTRALTVIPEAKSTFYEQADFKFKFKLKHRKMYNRASMGSLFCA